MRLVGCSSGIVSYCLSCRMRHTSVASVTGVQSCARPISANISGAEKEKRWRHAGDQKYFDTCDFHAGTMAGHVNYFSKIVKEVSNGCLLTGALNRKRVG